MAFQPGDVVRVLPPFDMSYPNVYVVAEPPPVAEGDDPWPPDVYWLVDVEPAFSSLYLELVTP